jgi:hypothetical protein
MAWTIIVGTVASVAVVACLLGLRSRWNRTPPELRGNRWWRFDREFRAYAEAAAGADQENGRGEASRA